MLRPTAGLGRSGVVAVVSIIICEVVALAFGQFSRTLMSAILLFSQRHYDNNVTNYIGSKIIFTTSLSLCNITLTLVVISDE